MTAKTSPAPAASSRRSSRSSGLSAGRCAASLPRVRSFRRVLFLLFTACVLLGCLSAGGCRPRLPAPPVLRFAKQSVRGQAGLPSTGHVAQVVDGDTIRLTDGTVIRYIG